MPADDELFAAEPRGLLGAEGPVAGVAGVGFGRDMAEVRADIQAARSACLVPKRSLVCWRSLSRDVDIESRIDGMDVV